MKKRHPQRTHPSREERLLRYGIGLFLKNKEIESLKVENNSGAIFLTRREIPREHTFAIGFSEPTEEEQYYDEEEKRR